MVKADILEKMRLRYARTWTSGGLSRLLQLLEQSPLKLRESQEATELRGDILADLRKYPAAQKAYEVVLKREPANYPVLVALGDLFLEQGKLEEALPPLRKAWGALLLEGSPQSLELAAVSLSDALRTKRMGSEALEVLNRSAERVGESAMLMLHKVDVLFDLRRFEDALSVLEVLPAHEIKMGLRKGRAYAGLEQYEKACFWLLWELAIDPNDLNALSLLVRCLLVAGRPKEALGLVESILRRKLRSDVKSVLLQVKRGLAGAALPESGRWVSDLEKARRRWIELDQLWNHITSRSGVV